MHVRWTALVLVPGALAAGCASKQPPRELTDARAAFQRAQSNPATQYDPADLMVARQTLDLAERYQSKYPGSQARRDLSYIAVRRAQLAEVRASAIMAQRQHAQAAQTAEQLASKQAMQARQQADAAQQQAAAEKEARQEVEQQLSSLSSKLASHASVEQQPRGIVISLTDSKLFPVGQAKLLPTARNSLDAVADTLRAQPQSGTVLIQGYSDSKGTEAKKLSLSQKRAEAVRDYLLKQGVPENMLRAEGRGGQPPLVGARAQGGEPNQQHVELILPSPAPKGKASGGGIKP